LADDDWDGFASHVPPTGNLKNCGVTEDPDRAFFLLLQAAQIDGLPGRRSRAHAPEAV